MRDSLRRSVVTLAAAAAMVSCGGGSDSPTTPSPTPTPTPSPGGGGSATIVTVTIANNAVSPSSVTVAPGSRVTFVNNDSRVHDMASNPHPEHTECPEINQVGFLQPGQSRTSGNLNTVRICGFHDHNDPLRASLQGTIRIQ